MKLSDEQLKNYTLVEMENALHNKGCSLQSYSNKFCPNEVIIKDRCNKFITNELNYDREALCKDHEQLFQYLTDEHRLIFDDIMYA